MDLRVDLHVLYPAWQVVLDKGEDVLHYPFAVDLIVAHKSCADLGKR